MNVNSFGTKVQQIIVMVLVVVLTILIVFYGYLPDNYNYSVGSISEKDIYASRTITDTYQTQYDALQAKNSVAAIFVKSSERSEENINSIENFFKSITSARDIISKEDGTEFQKTVAINTLKSDFQKNYNTEFDDELIELFLGASASTYRYIEFKGVSIVELMMNDSINELVFDTSIDNQIDSFKETNPSYSSFADALGTVYKTVLKPNTIFDEEATEDAEDNAYRTALDNPVTIERGARSLVQAKLLQNTHISFLKTLTL